MTSTDEDLVPPFPTDFVTILALAGLTVEGSRVIAADDTAGDVMLSLIADCTDIDGDGGLAASALRKVSAPDRLILAEGPAGLLVALDATSGPLHVVQQLARSSTLTTRVAMTRFLSLIGHNVYVSRADWGADEALRFDEAGTERWGSPPTYYPVQTLTVHHTATENFDDDPAARVRAIYRTHTIERQFGDIGYQLLIDEAGRVYEGRYSGEDLLPGHDENLLAVQGAHVGSRNSGNFGVALLGNLDEERPTAAAVGSLIAVLAVLATIHNLDPMAGTTYRSPVLAGESVDIATVPGHRDWSATGCPGGLLYEQLPWLREQVSQLKGRPWPSTLREQMLKAQAEGRVRPAA